MTIYIYSIIAIIAGFTIAFAYAIHQKKRLARERQREREEALN